MSNKRRPWYSHPEAQHVHECLELLAWAKKLRADAIRNRWSIPKWIMCCCEYENAVGEPDRAIASAEKEERGG